MRRPSRAVGASTKGSTVRLTRPSFQSLCISTNSRPNTTNTCRSRSARMCEVATGRLMSSIMNDIEKIQVATSHILADLLRQTFVVLGLLFVVLHKDWRLALGCLVFMPLILVPTARLGRRIRRTSRRTQDNAAQINQILQEALSGHQVVKAFGAEVYEARRFRDAARHLLRSN